MRVVKGVLVVEARGANVRGREGCCCSPFSPCSFQYGPLASR